MNDLLLLINVDVWVATKSRKLGLKVGMAAATSMKQNSSVLLIWDSGHELRERILQCCKDMFESLVVSLDQSIIIDGYRRCDRAVRLSGTGDYLDVFGSFALTYGT